MSEVVKALRQQSDPAGVGDRLNLRGRRAVAAQRVQQGGHQLGLADPVGAGQGDLLPALHQNRGAGGAAQFGEPASAVEVGVGQVDDDPVIAADPLGLLIG